jgi:1-acyl-sn-glycerol-3-phosphate acyltransferase
VKEIVRLILTPVWKTWFALCFAIPFLVLYPFFFLTIHTGNIRAAYGLKKVWAFLICLFAGIIPVIRYTKKYDWPKVCVVAANHTSYLDICLSVFYMKHTSLYMAKIELMKAPLFKIFFKGMDIPVDRKSRMGSHKAFVDGGVKIDQGYSMCIYPEGTISNEGALRPFKNGAFKLAIEKQVPIIPVANLNNWKLLQNGGFFKSYGRPGLANIVVGEPIETKGMTEENLVDLRNQVHAFIQAELDKYNGTKN